MKQNWTIWLDEPFIVRYVEWSGFKFYLIMQLIADQYIINIFWSNFVKQMSWETQNCKNFVKHSNCLISYVNFLPVSSWKCFNSKMKNSSRKQFYAFNVFETTVPLQCLHFFYFGKFYETDSRAKSRFWGFGFWQ